MGLLDRLFRGSTRQPESDAGTIHLAFILLFEARLPSAEAIIRSYSEFATTGHLVPDPRTHRDDHTAGEILALQFDSGEPAFVALMRAAVPNGEADEGARFSVSSLGTGWRLPEHCAHLMVTLPSSSPLSALGQLSRFTSLLAAVVSSSDSVGIYWGNAGATHDPQFFVTVAREPGVAPRIMLWSGVSVARENDSRLSLLSLGMQQLNLPDLLLIAPVSSQATALETFFDLLAYVAERGKPLPEGDTVGTTAQERLPVHYVDSPVDPAKKVWRVELQ